MKTTITSLITLFISLASFAQQGINYKAIIKDDIGNILASYPLSIKFSIYEGAALAIKVYEETETLNTNPNGLLIHTIGEGTTSDDLTDINWGDDEHWMEVEINTGSGFVMMGPAIEINAVPYALHAANVTGLEKITENDGTQDKTGWRLKGIDSLNYASIGTNAIDLSYSPIVSEENGAMGDYSFAAGYNSKALNSYSVAMRGGKASGFGSIAIGGGTHAASYAGMAIGEFNVGTGNPASWQPEDPLFEIGNGSTPSNRRNAMTVFKNGNFVIGSAQMDNDPAIADDDSRMFFNKAKSAFRAGLIQGTLGDDAQIGMYSTAFGRNNQAISANSVALGENNTVTGLNGIAIGNSNQADGQTSVALGAGTAAKGYYSTAMNLATTADALASTAIGRNNVGGGTPNDWIETDAIFEVGNSQDGNNKSNALTVLKNGTITAPSFDLAEITDDKALITKEYADTNLVSSGLEQITEEGSTGWRLKDVNSASYGTIGFDAVDLSIAGSQAENGATGVYSFATGQDTKAIGDISSAFGYSTRAHSYAEVVIGQFNTDYTPLSDWFWEENDRVFVIGNGVSNSNTSNALTVLKNGTITAPSLTNSLINTTGDKALVTKEYVDSNYLNSSGDVSINGSLNIQNTTDNTSSWRFTTVTAGHLSIYRNGDYRGFFNESSGAYTQGSDRRLKKDITSLKNDTLDKVIQLNPVSYFMKEQTDNKRHLGLISQEVQELFPSITHYVEEHDLLTLSYTELIPILIKALQEQQDIIKGQKIQIENLSTDNSSLENTVNKLITRVEKIEANNQ